MSNGNHNTFLGFKSGALNINGLRNTYIGSHSGISLQNGTGNVALGFGAGPIDDTTNMNNQLYINNAASDNPLIKGDFESKKLEFNGDVEINGDVTIKNDQTAGFCIMTETHAHAWNPQAANWKRIATHGIGDNLSSSGRNFAVSTSKYFYAYSHETHSWYEVMHSGGPYDWGAVNGTQENFAAYGDTLLFAWSAISKEWYTTEFEGSFGVIHGSQGNFMALTTTRVYVWDKDTLAWSEYVISGSNPQGRGRGGSFAIATNSHAHIWNNITKEWTTTPYITPTSAKQILPSEVLMHY